MDEGLLGDEGVAWPSYVDFFSTFVMVLLLLIGSLLYLISGDIEQQAFQTNIAPLLGYLDGHGYRYELHGRKLTISLKDKVIFATNGSVLDAASAAVLHGFATDIIAKHPDVKRIIIQGHADRQKTPDPFGNWQLSTDRATRVLRFFYLCSDCNYGQDVKGKLTLSGHGDLDADPKKMDNSKDRRVDVILDFSGTDEA